jgi:hypothetical protein
MKYLLILILVLISIITLIVMILTGPVFSQITQKEFDKFIFKFCDLIEDNKEYLKKIGWVTEGMAWGESRRTCGRCYAKYWLNLKKGQAYVFYTMSSGPRVRVCLAQPNPYREPIHKICYGSSDKVIWKYRARHTGEFMYLVEPASKREGAHKSYFTKIFKRKI